MRAWQELTDEEFITESLSYVSQKTFAQSFGLKRPSKVFRERIHRLGIVFDGTSLVSYDEFAEAVSKSSSIAEVVKYLNGGVFTKSYYYLVHKLSSKYDTPLPKYQGGIPPSTRTPDSEIFTAGTKRSGNTLRTRLIGNGVEYRCSEKDCPLHSPEEVIYVGEVPKVPWANKLITIQVDHIDGNNINNVMDNLRFLCPNCHAATDTYSGKNRKSSKETRQKLCMDCNAPILRNSTRCKSCATAHTYTIGAKNDGTPATVRRIPWPPTETIVSSVEELGYKGYSRVLGVSDNSIRRHLRSQGVHDLPKKRHRHKVVRVDTSS